MSTTIYNGFRLECRSFYGLHEFVQGLRVEFTALAKTELLKLFTSQCVRLADRRRVVAEEPQDVSPYLTVVENYWKACDDIKKGLRRPEFDFSFSLSLFPGRGCTYGVYFTEQPEWGKLFLAKPNVSDFHYQNQTDPPEEVPSQEWDIRRRVWKRLLPGAGVPSENSFTAEIVPERLLDLPKIEDIVKNVPTLEQRSRSLAEDLILEERCKADDSPKGWNGLFSAMTWMRQDPEGVARVAQLTETFRKGSLEPEITRESLLTPLPGQKD